MKKLVRAMAAVVAGGALLVATGGIAGAKEVSNEKYAKKVCAAGQGVLDDIDGLVAITTTDPTQFQTEALAATDTLLDSLDSATAKLKKLSPEDGGKKVTKLFDAYYQELSDKIREARDEFAAADPNGVAFTGDVTLFTVGIQNAPIGIDDPFAELTDNQDLLNALDDTKVCKNVVTII